MSINLKDQCWLCAVAWDVFMLSSDLLEKTVHRQAHSVSGESQLPPCKAGTELKLEHQVHPGCSGQSRVAQSGPHTTGFSFQWGVFARTQCQAYGGSLCLSEA